VTVRPSFPDGFLWGAATSSHQIEGDREGRGDNVWDAFSRVPGAVVNGDVADVACDHLRLMDHDVQMMADLGLRAYRFSISWPRVLRDGMPGSRSQEGIDQYRRLVDLLLAADIEPVPTLFHWDLPQALEDRGGFRNRDCASWFADYAALMVTELGDAVTRWATFNEPWCYAYLGHASGEHAPGMRDPAAAVAVAHHELLAHGLALQAMRAARPVGLDLGIVVNPAPVHVDELTDPDVARRIDGTLNRWWIDPVLLGRYPVDVLDDMGRLSDCVLAGDEAIIGQPIDWLGINYYNDHFYAVAADGPGPERTPHVTAGWAHPMRPDRPVTGIGWPVTPVGFEGFLRRLAADYGDVLVPLYITENGAAYEEPVIDGRVDDARRIDYYDAHLRAVHAALSDGVPVRGYFAWSLMDNFEWAHGFGQRFGIVHVDFDTLQRIPKASARWYAELCRTSTIPERSQFPTVT